MKEEKSYIYTFILGLCFMGCLLLIGKMMLTDKVILHVPYEFKDTTQHNYYNSEDGGDNIVMVTDENLQEIISNYMPDDFPLNDINVHICENNIIKFKANIAKKKLKTYLKNKKIELNPTISSLLAIAPNEFPVAANISAKIDEDGRSIILSAEKINVSEIELPSTLFSPAVFETINNALNNALSDNGIEFTKIEFADGVITLS